MDCGAAGGIHRLLPRLQYARSSGEVVNVQDIITSSSNPQVRHYCLLRDKARQRREEGLFAGEGIRLFTDAPDRFIERVFVSESLLQELQAASEHSFGHTAASAAKDLQIGNARGRQEAARVYPHPGEAARLLEKITDLPFTVLSDELMKKTADTKTPQGILFIARQPSWTERDVLGEKPLLLLTEDLQDPGNLGTIFRTAEAAGCTGLIMNRGTVDLFNPKTVRATMSAVFRQPFLYVEDLQEELRSLQKSGVAVYAAHLKGERYYDAPDYRGACGFLIGNEGNGLQEATADLAAEKILIPMEGRIESLNAAVSASILMYEAQRQRRHG